MYLLKVFKVKPEIKWYYRKELSKMESCATGNPILITVTI